MERVPMRSTEEGLEGMNENENEGELDNSASLTNAKQQDGRRCDTGSLKGATAARPSATTAGQTRQRPRQAEARLRPGEAMGEVRRTCVECDFQTDSCAHSLLHFAAGCARSAGSWRLHGAPTLSWPGRRWLRVCRCVCVGDREEKKGLEPSMGGGLAAPRPESKGRAKSCIGASKIQAPTDRTHATDHILAISKISSAPHRDLRWQQPPPKKVRIQTGATCLAIENNTTHALAALARPSPADPVLDSSQTLSQFGTGQLPRRVARAFCQAATQIIPLLLRPLVSLGDSKDQHFLALSFSRRWLCTCGVALLAPLCNYRMDRYGTRASKRRRLTSAWASQVRPLLLRFASSKLWLPERKAFARSERKCRPPEFTCSTETQACLAARLDAAGVLDQARLGDPPQRRVNDNVICSPIRLMPGRQTFACDHSTG
ncbi:hypothetical protein L1887_63507 [Cichorium endivia]|nr:hypothetical protein L1887_63507 [Cichorium endivia]